MSSAEVPPKELYYYGGYGYDNGLSDGARAGIGVGVSLFVIIVVVLIALAVSRRRSRPFMPTFRPGYNTGIYPPNQPSYEAQPYQAQPYQSQPYQTQSYMGSPGAAHWQQARPATQDEPYTTGNQEYAPPPYPPPSYPPPAGSPPNKTAP
ncbi:hypothetical protein ACI68E_003779 [Malassezia pachydermatis]|uniref:Uncharacterized protein n=1 Tax=Malassezia pachydermatis TaxID=77020 RepID=A0A0M9VNH1_9BASI|nr:hypothetical protein Malapachy_0255 [Malassezia pachydermatis]KOS13333.1 hypothetical protein Malapachy_0255 [Malassezia pachydermatis]